jgi:SAM-dependent methyltransferase
MPPNTHPCPICGSSAVPHDTVDFNKSCEEQKGVHLPTAGISIQYLLCPSCGFCFAPSFAAWSLDDFAEKIYNADYAVVDPDYADDRPTQNAGTLRALFNGLIESRRHLDYGGGNGRLAEILRGAGWNSLSYDPFVDRDMDVRSLGKFELITAFEVFEHVPDVPSLLADFTTLLAPEGLILFTTLISDGMIGAGQPLTWWYAAPRNGHISLFSRQSLDVLAASHGFNHGSFSSLFHAYFKQLPPWASRKLNINLGLK